MKLEPEEDADLGVLSPTATANCLYRPPVQRVFFAALLRSARVFTGVLSARFPGAPASSISTNAPSTDAQLCRAASSNAKTFFEGKPGSAARSARSRRPAIMSS